MTSMVNMKRPIMHLYTKLSFLILSGIGAMHECFLMADKPANVEMLVSEARQIIISQQYYIEQPTTPPTNMCIVVTNAQEIAQLAASLKPVRPLESDELFSYGSPVFFLYGDKTEKEPKMIMALYGEFLCWDGFPNGNARLTADSYIRVTNWVKQMFAKQGFVFQRGEVNSSRKGIETVRDPFAKGVEIRSTNDVWNSGVDPFSKPVKGI